MSIGAVLVLLEEAERATARATLAVAELIRSGEWAANGDLSPAAWLRRVAGLTPEHARSLAGTAARLRDLPVTASLLASGALDVDRVGLITAVATDRRRPLLAEHEADLVPGWCDLTPADLRVVVRRWADLADDELDAEPAPVKPNELWLSETIDGRRHLTASFDPLTGETIAAAIAHASTHDGDDDLRSAAERRADAIGHVCRTYLQHADPGGSNRNRPHVSVMIDLPSLESSGRLSLLGGSLVDAASTRQVLCDCDISRVVTDGPGVILDLGQTQRLVSRHQWHALVLRDKGCRHPGCDRPPSWCEAHHVIPWEHGGATDLSNLVLKCSRHHHVGHTPGWHDKLLPDGTYELTIPSGTTITSHPPP